MNANVPDVISFVFIGEYTRSTDQVTYNFSIAGVTPDSVEQILPPLERILVEVRRLVDNAVKLRDDKEVQALQQAALIAQRLRESKPVLRVVSSEVAK